MSDPASTTIRQSRVQRCNNVFALSVCVNPLEPVHRQRWQKEFIRCAQNTAEHSADWHWSGPVRWQVNRVLAPDRKLKGRHRK